MNASSLEKCIYPMDRITTELIDNDIFYYTSNVALAINLLSLPVCVFGNLLVLLAIITTPSLYTPTSIAIGSLALADFFVGAVLQPFTAFLLLKSDALFFCENVDTFIYLASVLASCSVNSMALVSLERYIALFFPLRYQTIATKRRLYIAWFCAWIIPTTTVSLTLYEFTAPLYAGTTVWGFSCLIIAVIYYKIRLLVQRHRRQIRSQQMPFSTERISQTKLAVTMGYVIAVSLMCYIPAAIAAFLIFFQKLHVVRLSGLVLTMVIQFTSSSINPVIYCWRRKDFRRASWNMIRKCCQRN